MLWHELAILAGAALVAALTWGGPNQIGSGTFRVLAAMRRSAKLNVFLGVRNLAESFLPDHLSHPRSFFRRQRANAFVPFPVVGSTLAYALLFGEAFAPRADAFRAVGFTLLGTLMALAVLEHWFMVLPLPFEAPWRRALRSRARIAPPPGRKTTRFDADHGTVDPFPVSFRMRVAASPGAAAVP